MTDPREIARRTSEARRLLDEPLLIEALELIERNAIEEMIQTPVWEPFWRHRKAHEAAHKVAVIRDFRRLLKSVIINGEEALKPPRRVA